MRWESEPSLTVFINFFRVYHLQGLCCIGWGDEIIRYGELQVTEVEWLVALSWHLARGMD